VNVLTLPWLEIALASSLLGALWVSLTPERGAAARWCVMFAALAFAACVMEWFAHYHGDVTDPGARWAPLTELLGRPLFAVDSLSAPLLPLVALLHLLTALSTAKVKSVRFSYSLMLLSEALRLATFGCKDGWALVVLLTAAVPLVVVELAMRRRPMRVFLLHQGLFVALLVGGWALVEAGAPDFGAALLFGAVLVRSGVVPVHCWITDLFEKASFGNALLFATPLAGAYLAVRLVLPIAPDWMLRALGIMSLITAVYAAGMAAVQQEARRFFAYLFLSHASLVLVGLELVTPVSLMGALAMWFSVALSLGGLGLALRALEARCGRLSLAEHHGLYEQSPALAVCFLLTGLASVGFPGTTGFISAELLVDGAVEVNLMVGLGVIVASALNSIAIVRAYFRLFTGRRRPAAGPALAITSRERFAVLTLAALILGGGLYPQPGIRSRHDAAEALLAEREANGRRATRALAEAEGGPVVPVGMDEAVSD
jgi:NADH-quinone oxidoreductase subunit M